MTDICNLGSSGDQQMELFLFQFVVDLDIDELPLFPDHHIRADGISRGE